MNIPITTFHAATSAALPQQAARESRTASQGPAAEVGNTAQQATEKLAKSTESNDRDAQEKYQGPLHPPAKKPSENQPEASPASPSASIWDLAVADEQPASDLDIRG